MTNPRTYKIAGSLFRYERSSSGKEEIRSHGPITQPIHGHVSYMFLTISLVLVLANANILLQILLREGHTNPGVSYEYWIPKSIKVVPTLTKFSWKASNYGICSATCAGGR